MQTGGDQDPMSPSAGCRRGDPNAAPRCGAKTRQGGSCRQPAMQNGRCRLHGGKSTGPRTAEGLERLRAARTKHGSYGIEGKRIRDLIHALQAKSRKLVELV